MFDLRRAVRRGLIASASALVLAGCTASTISSVPSPPASPSPASSEAAGNAPITAPIAAAWMYLADDDDYNTIPDYWKQIDFTDVDVLNVGPAGVQADGTFGLYSSPETGDLATRLKWTVETARQQNPNIKIILSQWWTSGGVSIVGGTLQSLTTDAAVEKYTSSVGTFLESWLGVSGGVDGYDVDYESDNVTPNISRIAAQIRTVLSDLTRAHGGRYFYQTISPSTVQYLDDAVRSIDLVNMQTYAGGLGLRPQDFTALGWTSQQLLYGVCPESNCESPTLAQAETEYTKNRLAGIHLWRLNSDNYAYEGDVQAQSYTFLHP